MKTKLESCVVVRWPRGWVAHVRFDNPRKDADISSHSRYVLGMKIQEYVEAVNVT